MFDVSGLSARDELVYRTMLQHPELTVAGLADHLSLSRAEVHETLDVLADLARNRLESQADFISAPSTP